MLVLERGLKQPLQHSKGLLHVGRQMWVFMLMQRAWKEARFQRDEKHLKRNTLRQPRPAGQHESWLAEPRGDRQTQAGTGRGQALGFCLWHRESNSCGLTRPKRSIPSAMGLSQAESFPGGCEGSEELQEHQKNQSMADGGRGSGRTPQP